MRFFGNVRARTGSGLLQTGSIVSYTHSFPPVNSAGLAGFTWQKRRPERERPASKRKRIGGLVNRASLKMPLDILRLSSNISCFNPRKFYLGIESWEMLKLVHACKFFFSFFLSLMDQRDVRATFFSRVWKSWENYRRIDFSFFFISLTHETDFYNFFGAKEWNNVEWRVITR